MKRLFIGLFALALMIGSGHAALAQATVTTYNTDVPVSFTLLNPCGESIAISGEVHVLVHQTTHGDGTYSYASHVNYQGVNGVGVESGDKYQTTSTTNATGSGTGAFNSSYADSFHLIGQGTTNDYLVHTTIHFTINDNGEFTAFVDNFKVECQG